MMADFMGNKGSSSGRQERGAQRFNVREELDTGRYEYDLHLPSGFSKIHLATARVEREGGDTKADWEFRSTLYYLIGAGVVKAGQIEDAMKRLLTLISGGKVADFAGLDATWTALHNTLKKRASRDGPPGNTVSVALEWAEDKQIKKIRDDLIHANWWDFSGVGVRSTRFAIRKDGTVILGSVDDLKHHVELLGQYELMLDECIGPHWPRVYLPLTSA